MDESTSTASEKGEAGNGTAARILREPLIAFAALGLLIFALFEVQQDRSDQQIVLTSSTRAGLLREFEVLTGRAPQAEEIAKLEQNFVTDTILLREGVAQDLHLTDGQIRTAIIDRMRRDVVGPPPTPDAEALVNYYGEHIERYYAESTISFRQVFFLNPPQDPEAILTALRRGETVNGDPYWQGNRFPAYGESVIRAIFEAPFLSALRELPLDEWSGPIDSPRGQHFVLVDARAPARLLSFEQARRQVGQDYLVDWMERELDSWLEERQNDYQVIIEQ